MFYNTAMDCNYEINFKNYSLELSDLNNSFLYDSDNLNFTTLPTHLRFNKNTLTVILVYIALFIVAAVGNLTVFLSLFKSRHRKSRISLMIRHLALADLLVTFIMIPIEVGWRFTVQWMAGNLACKAFLFLRAFGLYLSSNILVCVSLDRYFAILHPLRVSDARRRGKFMLACAWTISLIYSVPQSFVFHIAAHPNYPTFLQCVSFGFFPTQSLEVAYNVFCLAVMYFIPLIVIIIAYSAIMCKIYNKSQETKREHHRTSKGKLTLRRSDIRNIARARSRTLKMTITIVAVFVWCWTPYVVMTLWYMIDRNSAEKLPNWLQDALFMMAVSNSCMNPMVYGSYAMNFRKECSKCFCCKGITDEPALTRKSTDAVPMIAAAEQRGLVRRVFKCVFTLRKVGSGATRSTCTAVIQQGIIKRSQPNEKKLQTLSFQNNRQAAERPLSVGYISVLTDHTRNRGYLTNYHSDPYPCTDDKGNEATHHSFAYSTSPRGQLDTTLESKV